MAKFFQPQIVSANDLLRGDVIYLDMAHGWTRSLRSAAVARTAEAADALLVAASAQPEKAVGPYLLNVTIDDDGLPFPSHFREKFRDRGPTNRLDLGRQAQTPPRIDPISSPGGI